MAQQAQQTKSEHFLTLLDQDKERYEAKLIVDGLKIPDPYTIPKEQWVEDCSKWPSVEYGDVFNYLVNTPGIYTHEAMKAYKSLDGYNFFISGHVQQILFHDIAETSACLLKAYVLPSQKVSNKKDWHHTWLIVSKNSGCIMAAHCTCKAGTGEACSHIAAILFKVEAAVKLGLNNPSKTSLANQWNRCFREKVTAKPLTEINFSRPVYGKQGKENKRRHSVSASSTFDENEALRHLKRICPDACVLTKDDSDTDTGSDDENMPPILVREHKLNKENLSPEDIQKECQIILKDFKVSTIQAGNLEKITRSQAQSITWQRQRVGRITASLVHDIKTLKDETSPDRCLKKILKTDERDLSNIEHVSYGIKNEKKARNLYATIVSKDHENFSFRDCGLVIDTTFPVFAASPDGVRTCSCHGEGLIEIKCCSVHRDLFVQEIPNIDNNFCLERNTLRLKQSHRYYSQVQFQMYVCQKKFCDFVLFTDKGVFFQRIDYDASFIEKLVDKCFKFTFDHLLPEIIFKKIENK